MGIFILPGRLGLDMILASTVSSSVEYWAPQLLRSTGRLSRSPENKSTALAPLKKKKERHLLWEGVASALA